MKVNDITRIMDPWQSLRIKEADATQLDDPLFDNMIDIRLPKENEQVSQMEVVGIDSDMCTIVLYVR